MKKKTKAWSVYSILGESLVTRCVPKEVVEILWRETVCEGQMPRESWEDACDRYIIVPVTISYSIPSKGKKK